MFQSLQEAKEFINCEAEKYTRRLLKLGQSIGSTPYIWHNNQVGVMDMFMNNGHNFSENYAIQALDDAVIAGYIDNFGPGGLRITPKGFQELGHWFGI